MYCLWQQNISGEIFVVLPRYFMYKDGRMEHTLVITPVEAGPVATIGYFIADKETGTALVIDAPWGSAAIFQQLAQEHGVVITDLWLTHSHWDHTADAAALQRAGAAIAIHPEDEYRLAEPMEHSIWPLPFTIEGVTANTYVHHGDTRTFGKQQFAVLHTPGHTEGGVCFVDKENNLAFVGDTLFAGSIGRTDLPGGDMNTLLHSIHEHLLVLGDDMCIFPGHGPASTIGEERVSNPYLGAL